jgi:hypothetical protein
MNGALIGGLVGGGLGVVALIVGGIWIFSSKKNLPVPPGPAQPVAVTPATPTPAVAQPTPAAPTTPTVPTTPTTPTTPAAPQPTAPGVQAVAPTATAVPVARKDSDWNGFETTAQVPHNGNDSKVAYSPGGKFIAVDRAIYDSTDGQEVWAAPAAFGGGSKSDVLAVSPNGTLMAEADEKGASLTL